MNNKVVNIIKELDQYIAEGKSRLQTILKTLDWTIEDTLKESTCPPANTENKESFDTNDLPLPESFDFTNSMVIDELQLKTIVNKPNVKIPEKFSDIQLNFTREQKANIYDYVISNTEKTFEPELKVSFPNDAIYNGMTFAEIVAKAKKIDKQFRRKYRTSKPTHIEELRNLVHLQMTALEKYFHPKSEPPSPSLSFKSDQERNSKRSQCRDNFEQVSEKTRSHNIEETVQTNFSEFRKRTTTHHPYIQNRRKDRRENTARSRSPDRSNRLLNWKCQSVERREHRRIKIEDEISYRREDTVRSRSPDRINRSLDWKCPSVERREHIRIKIEDEISDIREDTTRRRNTDRSNRLLDWKCPSVERREHRSVKKEDTLGRQSTDRSNRLSDRKSIEMKKYRSVGRSENKDESSKTKKKPKGNKNSNKKKEKKHKHHRKHSTNK